MVVLYCPACGKKVLIKGDQPGTYPVEFSHCGHLISINLENKANKN